MSHIKVDVKYSTIGPRHDPYGRTTYTAIVGGHHIKLTFCGLAGTSLETDGVVQPFKGGECTKEFERLIGCSLDVVEEELSNAYSEDPMGHPSQYE